MRDPRAPALAGSYDTPGSARGVTVAGATAYVADDFTGLQIVDVSRPSAPVLVGGYDTPGRAVGVVVAGSFAFVADLNRGLQILDVSRPEAPVLVQSLSTPGAAEGVALSSDRLYIADGFAGLLEVDVRDPARPVVAGAYDTPGIASGVAVDGGLAYVADGSHGLQIVAPNPPLPAASSVAGTAIAQPLPAGFSPGPYDVQVTQPAGGTLLLPDGFFVCPRHRLDARLVTQVGARRPPRGVAPARAPSSLWRLELSGDAELFAPGSQRQARLLLPALPQDMEVRFAPGPVLIDLRLDRRSDRGVALLSGPSLDAVAPLWRAIRAGEGIDLPGLDDHSYGP